MEVFKCEEIIVGGDFNLVLDLAGDKKGGLDKTHTKALKVIEQYAAKLDLIDAWRVLNQDARRYTWRRRNPEIHCRLDFFLVSQSVMYNVKDTDISAGYKTDHSLITIKIAQHSNTRGPGFWKLNKSFLKGTEYINQIRETIEQVKLEYREDKYVNPALMWEMIKLKIRVKSIRYGKSKRSRMLREEEQLESLVNNLQKDIENGKKEDKETITIQRKLDETTRKLEKIIEYKTKGAILRSKCRWHNEGEKNTKYFLNLEKRHYKNSVITQLKVSDTDFITSDIEILNECETFYRNIYSSKTNSLDSGHLFFDATFLPSLDPEEKEKGEGPLTKTECFQALKSMNGEKTPGSDGLPADFYKVFWNNLADCLVNSINYAYQVRQFSVSQRRGIIKVILKKDADPCLRPITLLNTDYKIAAKAIANRLKIVIPKIVNNDQTGFIKGRFIGENIRLIQGIINYTATQNIPGQLLFLDFEKAFDTVERSFIWKTLESFNFGSSIINWIKLCYQNIESCILNNGWASGYFTLDRGVRQGCPLSPYIFIICVELLAEKIRQNKTVKGISVQNEEIKISQFANDATIILDGSKESFTAALQHLEQFGFISGLRLVLSSWKYRRLSLLGKITVLKSLVASQFVYILAPLPSNHTALDEFNRIFYNFLWDGKGDKIKRDSIISE